MMAGISFALKSTNSNSTLRMYFDKQKDGTISVTAVGTHNGDDIQIDFDCLSVGEAKDLAAYIAMRADGEPNV